MELMVLGIAGHSDSEKYGDMLGILRLGTALMLLLARSAEYESRTIKLLDSYSASLFLQHRLLYLLLRGRVRLPARINIAAVASLKN